LEERRRRVVLENREAPYLDLPYPSRRARPDCAIKKGAHVLVEGSLVSSVYLPANGKSKKNKPTKITSWTIRADAVRRLDRGESEPQAPASGTSEHSFESSEGETF
jgi:hypothetical protein